MRRYQWHILTVSPFFPNFLLFEGFLRFLFCPDLRITDISMLYSAQPLLSHCTKFASTFFCCFAEVGGSCTSTIVLPFFLSHIFNSSFIDFFYLTPSCWTGRPQSRAKHISHWNYLHDSSSEFVLFFSAAVHCRKTHSWNHTQLWLFQRDGENKQQEQNKKYRSRNTLFNCFLTEIKLWSSRMNA